MNSTISTRVVSYAEAAAIVREHAQHLAQTLRPAEEAAALLDSLGRVLAEPVTADRDQPPFHRSTRDGFACRAADLAGAEPLLITGSVRAGEGSGQAVALSQGQAVEIMTGAPVPEGADCVVMVEHVQRDGNLLRLSDQRTITPGDNIVPQGAEALADAVILRPGTRLTAPRIGMAAASGRAELRVFQRPRVAIVATGDELVELDRKPLTHQIRNSNSYSLAAQVLAAGAEPLRLPIARDDRAHLESVIHSAFKSDLLLLSGGVSMGKYDLVEEVLLSLGAEFFFTGALIQPGKPVVFGRLPLPGRSLYFFGLPGNPVSTLVTFSLFAWPLLSVLCGEPLRGPHFAQARLARTVDVKPGLTRFLPASLLTDVNGATVELVTWQGSGDLAAASRSDCFLVIPADRPQLSAGETVTVLLA
jgi:molybdopterin molybdotransferase